MDRHATACAFEAFGARIRVLAAPRLVDRLSVALPPDAKPTSGEGYDTTYFVEPMPTSDDGVSVRLEPSHSDSDAASPEEAFDRLVFASPEEAALFVESDLHFRVAVGARDVLFVHAGVVRHGDTAILIPGSTRSGKSSLVHALVREGAVYYSDEYAVLDREGWVRPYPKPLSERVSGSERPRLHEMPVPPPDAVWVGTVVSTHYLEGAEWSPRALTPAEAVLALFQHTVLARARPEFALEVLTATVASAAAWEGARGDATRTASLLLNAERPRR